METMLKTKAKTKIKITPGFKLFLASSPFLILIFLFQYLPLEGWKYALYNYKPGYALENCEFVGLKHFFDMFSNGYKRKEIARVLINTFAMAIINISTSFIPMFFAIALTEVPGKKYKKIIQTFTTVPHFVSWVLVYALAFAMFSTHSGLVNVILIKLGIIDEGINILATTKNVWVTMWLYGLWKGLGWNSIVYISGVSSLDQELFEAAAVDGASRIQKIIHITIPGLMPTFITLLILSIGSVLDGGMGANFIFQNAFNRERIETLDLYVYNMGLGGGNNISYSTAIGIWKSAVGISLMLFVNWISGKVRGNKIF